MSYHEPVLLDESVEGLGIVPGGTYVDATYGGGGHSKKILERLNTSGRLIAFDRDEEAVEQAAGNGKLQLVHHNFRYLKRFLRYLGAIPVQGILADLGVSSHQFDEAKRGFSLRYDAPLDMRMSRRQTLTAAEVLNTYPAERLQQLLSEYGEVHNARTVARRIVSARADRPVTTTGALRDLLADFLPKAGEHQYLAKVFQALRIEVNDELGALRDFLAQAAEVLAPGGRLVVIAYHSLEDRLVKNFLRDGRFDGPAGTDLFGRRLPPVFRLVHRKPVEAGEEETAANPRARSAKMRIAEKI